MSAAVSGFDRRDAIDVVAVVTMLGLTLSWGLNGVAAKLSNTGYDPVFLAVVRSLIGGVLVYLWCALRRVRLFDRDGSLWLGLLVGALFGIEFLLIVNILLLVAGNVMEPSSIVLITAPILFPIAVALGIHPVHLGILMTVNMEIGLCHPPVGLNLYVASGITKMGITELTVAVWPWLLSMLIFLILVTYVPWISLALPRALGMM